MTERTRCGRPTKQGTPCRLMLSPGGKCPSHSCDLSARNKAVRAAFAAKDPAAYQAHQALAGARTAGPKHGKWKGDDIKVESGRRRAQRKYQANACIKCGTEPADPKKLHRHHKDLNPRNNAPDNIEILCQDCHLAAHNGDYHWYAVSQPEPERVFTIDDFASL